MAETKKAQKPTGPIEEKVAQGQEKAPAAEVSGHMSPGAFYTCWNDGAVNYIPFGWNYFYCCRCWALNRV
jgi:hypothetical protein